MRKGETSQTPEPVTPAVAVAVSVPEPQPEPAPSTPPLVVEHPETVTAAEVEAIANNAVTDQLEALASAERTALHIQQTDERLALMQSELTTVRETLGTIVGLLEEQTGLIVEMTPSPTEIAEQTVQVEEQHQEEQRKNTGLLAGLL